MGFLVGIFCGNHLAEEEAFSPRIYKEFAALEKKLLFISTGTDGKYWVEISGGHSIQVEFMTEDLEKIFLKFSAKEGTKISAIGWESLHVRHGEPGVGDGGNHGELILKGTSEYYYSIIQIRAFYLESGEFYSFKTAS